jgi:nitrite reductase/ring-hydroxylating ferredoxin subunit
VNDISRRLAPPAIGHALPAPLGWYAPCASEELPRNGLRTFRLAGRDLVLWRTAAGVAHASDAYCPHLGAHFGHGGTVEGETLRCPFHGFCFDGAGACVKTGYDTTPPKDARLFMWPVIERHGFVFVWYHPHGAPPSFDLPDVDTDGWAPWRYHRWELDGHPQETTENSVDIGHLSVIHKYTDLGELAPLVVDGPLLHARYFMHRDAGVFGRGGKLRAEFDIYAWGLGYSRVEVHVPEYGIRTRHLVFCTPTDRGRAQLLVGLSMDRPAQPGRINPFLSLLPRALVQRLATDAAFRAFKHDVQQDFDIWQNKTYVERPVLATGDGPIVRYRRWTRQFYVRDEATALAAAEPAEA